MKTVKMKNKNRLRQIASAMIASIMLIQAVPPAHSTGIPVLDGAQQFHAAIMRKWEMIDKWQAQLKNWKNLLRKGLSKVLGIDLSPKFSEQDLIILLEKRRIRCSKLKNSKSEALCSKMIDLEIEKVETFMAREKWVQEQLRIINQKIQRHSDELNTKNNAGKLESREQDIENNMQHVNNMMQLYEHKIKLIDEKLEWMRKARIAIAKEQLTGSNIASTSAKASAIAWLKEETHNVRTDADNLRNDKTIDNKIKKIIK